MRNSVRFAQWTLSLVTTPERAASAVGDLMEDGGGAPGTGWFWSRVAGAALSLLWREIAAEPARMASLAVRGFLVNLTLVVVFFAVLSVLFGIVAGFMGAVGLLTVQGNALPWWAEWLARLMGFLLLVACDFQTGRWVARRAPGKEIAACISMVAAEAILASVGGAVFGLIHGERISIVLLDLFAGLTILQAPLLVFRIPCLAGAAWVRRRAEG